MVVFRLTLDPCGLFWLGVVKCFGWVYCVAMKLGNALKNARGYLLKTVIGSSPRLVFCSGPEPATTDLPETGVRLAVLDLPLDWISDPVDGVMSQVGVWEQASAQASGVPGYFRIYDQTGTTCHLQGKVGPDITGSPTANITVGVACSVVAWSWVER